MTVNENGQVTILDQSLGDGTFFLGFMNNYADDVRASTCALK